MTRLTDLMADEFDSAEAQLALELAREDQHLLAELVAIRKRRMTQEQVAEALGLSQATISSFERLGNDPHLSTIRRYARVVGAMVRHHIDEDVRGCADSHYISHVDSGGVRSAATATALARALTRQNGLQWPESTVDKRVSDEVTV